MAGNLRQDLLFRGASGASAITLLLSPRASGTGFQPLDKWAPQPFQAKPCRPRLEKLCRHKLWQIIQSQTHGVMLAAGGRRGKSEDFPEYLSPTRVPLLEKPSRWGYC
jgi:hypothetical protein